MPGKILLINKFLYPKGGDAICSLATGELLRKNGHNVIFWGMKHPSNTDFPYADNFVNNVDYARFAGIKKQFWMAANLLYSIEAKKKVELIVNKEKPDIIHLHNFAHQISPSILHVFKKHDIPVVMTMHDYKLVCPAYTLLAKGQVCRKCEGGRYINCLFNKCVKDSSIKSFLSTLEMYLHHSLMHIYELIDIFISPSSFLKDKVREMGFPGKVIHLYNFVRLDEIRPHFEPKERVLVYCGRLAKEKGVATLIEAVKGLDITVKIIGEGPVRGELQALVEKGKISNVHFLGYLKEQELNGHIRKSMAIVLPSLWYENNPRSVIEAFSLGTPALGSRIGGITELVLEGKTGFTFEPGNVDELRRKIIWMIEDPAKCIALGKKARIFAEQECNAQRHYEKLIEIYKSVMK